MPGTVIEGAAKTHPHFFAACKMAKIPPTTRQLRKWNRRIGLAETYRAEVSDLFQSYAEGKPEAGKLFSAIFGEASL